MEDKFGRPDWDNWFLTLCLVISQKSIDPRTKHGAILVSKDNRILSIGYNGPIRGSVDENIPIYDDRKYLHLLHAEENCLLNYFGSAQDLGGATLYVTGKPCHKCMRMILQKGIKKIVTGPITSFCKDGEDEETCKEMIIGQQLQIKECLDVEEIFKILDKTKEYVIRKVKTI